jgi:Rieske Fe-S protein
VASAAALAASTLAACGVPGGPGMSIVGPALVRVALPAIGATVSADGVGEGGVGIAVTRVSDTAVVAVSRLCTHQACAIDLPQAGGASMLCPCHGSVFTTAGAVVRGPAQSSLRTFAATIDAANNQVVITNS